MKLYYDGKPVDASAGSGEVYSTEETRIGIWIDGRPLYRKAGKAVSPSQGDGRYHDIGEEIQDLSEVIHIHGTIFNAESVYFDSFFATATGGVQFSIAYFKHSISDYSPGVKLYLPTNASTNFLSRPIIWVVEYTKTTDESAAVTLESKIPMQQSGFITQGDSVYHYEIPDVDVIASASASASNTYSAFSSISSANFH